MNVMTLAMAGLALVTMGGCMHVSETAALRSQDDYWQSTYTRHLAYYTELWCANTCAQCQPCVADEGVHK